MIVLRKPRPRKREGPKEEGGDIAIWELCGCSLLGMALLELADTHMTLEDQKVKVDFDERIKILADKLIKKGDVW